MTSAAEAKSDSRNAEQRSEGRGADQRAASTRNMPQGESSLRRNAPPPANRAGMSLTTEAGKTRIADSVVAKIAGLAARDIPGVYSMGTGFGRRVGQLRSLMPGASDSSSQAMQGVNVEVGEREAAIDLDVVTWYGQSIVDVTSAVRDHVIEQVENMTGLKVVEVNISVDDIQVEAEQQDDQSESRVQ